MNFRGKATNTIRDRTKRTKAGAHTQGPTEVDAENAETLRPPTTLEQRQTKTDIVLSTHKANTRHFAGPFPGNTTFRHAPIW